MNKEHMPGDQEPNSMPADLAAALGETDAERAARSSTETGAGLWIRMRADRRAREAAGLPPDDFNVQHPTPRDNGARRPGGPLRAAPPLEPVGPATSASSPEADVWVSPYAVLDKDTGEQKLKWNKALIGRLAKDSFTHWKNSYDPRDGTFKGLLRNAAAMGAGEITSILALSLIAPGSDRLIKTAITIGASLVVPYVTSLVYTRKELGVIRTFHGDEMEARLKYLLNERASTEAKIKKAVGSFALGAAVGAIGFNIFGDVFDPTGKPIQDSLPKFSQNSQPTSGIPENKPSLPSIPNASELPKVSAPVVTIDKPDVTKWPGEIGQAGDNLGSAIHKTTGWSRPDWLKIPFTGGETPSAPSATAVATAVSTHETQATPAPIPTVPAPRAVPTPDILPAGETALVFKDGASLADDLKAAIDRNGDITRENFSKVLDRHQGAEDLQGKISAQVEESLDLKEKIARQAAQLQGLDYDNLPDSVKKTLNSDAQHQLEGFANDFYRGKLIDAAHSGADTNQVIDQAAASFQSAVHSDQTVEVFAKSLKDEITRALPTQSEILAEITKGVPLDTIPEVVIPDHSSVGHLVEASGYQLDWTPAGTHYVDTVNIFQAEALINHDSLSSYYKELMEKGFLGENPTSYLSITEINNYAELARNGDADAFKKLVDALHWVKAGDNFRVITPDQLEKIKAILLAAKRS